MISGNNAVFLGPLSADEIALGLVNGEWHPSLGLSLVCPVRVGGCALVFGLGFL